MRLGKIEVRSPDGGGVELAASGEAGLMMLIENDMPEYITVRDPAIPNADRMPSVIAYVPLGWLVSLGWEQTELSQR